MPAEKHALCSKIFFMKSKLIRVSKMLVNEKYQFNDTLNKNKHYVKKPLFDLINSPFSRLLLSVIKNPIQRLSQEVLCLRKR